MKSIKNLSPFGSNNKPIRAWKEGGLNEQWWKNCLIRDLLWLWE